MIDIKEQVINKIKSRIENPKFVSKVEVARLSLNEYEKQIGNLYLEKFKQQEKRLEILEFKSRDINVDSFNEGYNQALKDYDILKKKNKSKKCFCGGEKVWKKICKECSQLNKELPVIREVVEKWHNENVTSWKYLEKKGLKGAEEFGNVIAINCLGYDTIEQLIKELENELRKPNKKGKEDE